MKQKILFFCLFILVAVPVFSQAIAYPVPNIQRCENETVDLIQQNAVVLGNQNPQAFTVGYFATQTDADSNSNPVGNPVFYNGISPMTIFIRVTNTVDSSYAVTAFQILWNALPQINAMDIYQCGYFQLPYLNEGSYHTGPGGSGILLHAGDEIYQTQTIYILADNGNCIAEQSFTVYILEAVAPMTIAACNSYTLSDSEATYYNNADMTGAAIPVWTTFTASTTIYGFSSFWCGAREINLIIGNVPFNIPTPLYGCDSDNDGFAWFDLDSKIQEITGNVAGLSVGFFDSQASAQAGTDALQSPYTNTTQNGQTVYARIQTTTGNCYEVTPLQLLLQPCSTISGIVRLDADLNGCNTADAGISGVPLSLGMGNYLTHTYTNNQGQYSFENVPNGFHHVSLYPGNIGNAAPTGYNFALSEISSQTGDFCVTPAQPIDDVAVFLYTNGNARPGAAVNYIMACRNLGNTTLNGTVTLQFDSAKLSFVSASPAQTSVNGAVISFNFGSLMPSQTAFYQVHFNVMQPPNANLGDVLTFEAVATTAASDVVPQNNSAVLHQVVVNSLDPNDISVAQGPLINDTQLAQDLVYTVRFQNTGNAQALNVHIEDALDTDLDWTTFRPVGASHPYTVERINGQLSFRFNGIDLASAQANEPLSHGYVTYRVKPVSSLSVGDLIENSAQIYFDFNAPIATNTVTTQLTALGFYENNSSGFTFYPNPVSGDLTLQFSKQQKEVLVRLYDVSGKLIKTETLHPVDTFEKWNVSGVAPGMYFLKVIADGQSTVKTLIINSER